MEHKTYGKCSQINTTIDITRIILLTNFSISIIFDHRNSHNKVTWLWIASCVRHEGKRELLLILQFSQERRVPHLYDQQIAQHVVLGRAVVPMVTYMYVHFCKKLLTAGDSASVAWTRAMGEFGLTSWKLSTSPVYWILKLFWSPVYLSLESRDRPQNTTNL